MTKAEMARAVAQLLHSIYGLNQQEARQAAMQALPARDGSVTVYIGQNDKEAAEEFDAESDEEEYEHVLSSSSTWGRLYRPTVRSSESNKETISMWLCVPESERVKDGRRDGEPEGGLQRQVGEEPWLLEQDTDCVAVVGRADKTRCNVMRQWLGRCTTFSMHVMMRVPRLNCYWNKHGTNEPARSRCIGCFAYSL